ncbi:MAG: hypothetical protein AAFS10_09140 [Myxococcota bacterium]
MEKLISYGAWFLIKIKDTIHGSAIPRTAPSAVMLWLWATVVYSYAALRLLRSDPVPEAVVEYLVLAGAAHLTWGVGLLRDWGQSPSFRAASRIVLGFTGLAVLWALWGGGSLVDGLLYPEAVAHGAQPAMAKRQLAFMVMAYAVGLALIHTPRWTPKFNGALWAVLRLLDKLVSGVAWAVLALSMVSSCLFVLWESAAFQPNGSAVAVVSGSAILQAAGFGALFYMVLTVATLVAQNRGFSMPYHWLRAQPLPEVLRPWRRRLDMALQIDSMEMRWYIPATGAATLIGVTAPLALAMNTPGLMVGAVGVGLALMPLSIVWGWARPTPFGALAFDIDGRDTLAGLAGVEWRDGAVYIDLDHVHGDPEELEGLFPTSDEWPWARLRLPARELRQVRLMHVSEMDEADPITEELKPFADWFIEFQFGEERIILKNCFDETPSGLLAMMADLWFLAHRAGCIFELPHRRMTRAFMRTGLQEEVVAQFKALSRFGRDRYDGELFGDADFSELACCRHDDQGQVWWLLPDRVVYRRWRWLVVPLLLGCIELIGWWSLQETWGTLVAVGLLMRVLTLSAFSTGILAMWLVQRQPDIYAIAVNQKGITLHDTHIAWSEISDITLISPLSMPVVVVARGRLIGLPVFVPDKARFHLSGDIGVLIDYPEQVEGQKKPRSVKGSGHPGAHQGARPEPLRESQDHMGRLR